MFDFEVRQDKDIYEPGDTVTISVSAPDRDITLADAFWTLHEKCTDSKCCDDYHPARFVTNGATATGQARGDLGMLYVRVESPPDYEAATYVVVRVHTPDESGAPSVPLRAGRLPGRPR